MSTINAQETLHRVNEQMDDLPLPLPQSPEFARAAALLNVSVRRRQQESAGRLTGIWQIQSRGFYRLGEVDLLSRGPVWRSDVAAQGWLRRIPGLQGTRPLILNADTLLPPHALRATGFWPLVSPATIAMLRLKEPGQMRAAFHQKWRNRLNRAEAAGLQLDWQDLHADEDHWLLRAEAAQQRCKGYRGWPMTFVHAFAAANPGQARLLTARYKSRPVAAALFLCHGQMATYQIGHSLPEGRQMNAMNLVLWEAMRALAARGHSLLDLGTLNSEDSAGLAHFKLGTGAEAQRQGGTWLYHRNLAPLARRLPDCLAAWHPSVSTADLVEGCIGNGEVSVMTKAHHPVQ
jgi:hypothetical protein